MTSGERGMVVFCGGLVACIIAAVALQLTGHDYAALVAGTVVPLAWCWGVMLWLAAFDSKKRWPGEPFLQRLGSILSFRRD
jgi:hypothetical protein